MFFVLAAAAAIASPYNFFGPSLTQIGVDPLTSAGTEHSVAVGSVVATNGQTTVSVYQVGRYSGDAAAALAFSSQAFFFGWQEGLVPGITKATNPANPYDRVTFETVVWNQRFNEFIISALPIVNTPSNGDSDTTLPPIVSTSSDGFHWSNPVATSNAVANSRPEKNFLTCDNSYASRYYGNCYEAWDDNDAGDRFHVNVSTDGGRTWSATRTALDGHGEYGAVPVIQPNGTVIVTSEDSSGYDGTETKIISSVSSDGGATWSAAYLVSNLAVHAVAGPMRTQPLPTSGVDGNGNVYTIWQDCRFRAGCSSNDLVLSTSRNGVNWTSPVRIGLDSTASGVDHFLPTLAVRNSFFGTTLGLTYYAFPKANCTLATCALVADFSNSGNGGASWSSPEQIAGPYNLISLAATGAGYMVGDYFTSVYGQDGDLAPIAVASAPSGSTYHETIALPSNGWFGGGLARSGGRQKDARHELGAADGAALHAGARPATYLPARIAAPVSYRSHHPM